MTGIARGVCFLFLVASLVSGLETVCEKCDTEKMLIVLLDEKVCRLSESLAKTEMLNGLLQEKVYKLSESLQETKQALTQVSNRLEHLEVIHTNLALSKPAFQSSVYSNNPLYKAENGVDGKTNPDQGECTHTKLDRNPWWAVDLGKEFNITKVSLFNRHLAPERLNSIVIGVTNTSPLDEAPTLNNYQLCVRHNPAIPESSAVTLSCVPGPVLGRYVIVQLDQNPQYLTLCEVEVYGHF